MNTTKIWTSILWLYNLFKNSAYPHFGMESRTCIGISLMGTAKIVPEIVRYYNIELIYLKRPLTITNYRFYKEIDFIVSVSRRK
jgi:hypothetical protein